MKNADCAPRELLDMLRSSRNSLSLSPLSSYLNLHGSFVEDASNKTKSLLKGLCLTASIHYRMQKSSGCITDTVDTINKF